VCLKLRCLIVDDEPLAVDVIRCFVAQMDELELVGTCENALDAMSRLQADPIDLLFLDIQMPLLDGLELLRILRHPPKVIVTTAYRNYAVESFELEVQDYLVKPIAFSRFVKAVSRVVQQLRLTPQAPNDAVPAPVLLPAASTPEATSEYILLKVDKQLQKVLLADIIYIESLKDYVRVVTSSGALVTYLTLSGLTAKLPAETFIRIHKSYTVAMHRVSAVRGNEVEIAGQYLPLGRVYKAEVLTRICTKGILGLR